MPARESGGSKTKSGAKKKAEEFQAKEKAKGDSGGAPPAKKGGKGAKNTKGDDDDEDGDPKRAAALAKEKARLEELDRKAKLKKEAEAEADELAASSKKAKGPTKIKPAGPGAIAALKSSKKNDDNDLGLGNTNKDESIIAVSGDYDALIKGAETVLSSDRPDAIRAQAATKVDKRPEKRYHAAWEVYKERELPSMRDSHPGLNQHKHIEILRKQFEKSPENPMNGELVVNFNSTTDDAVQALEMHKLKIEKNL